MMSQFMVQGGHSIAGNAIKWRKTSANVPFSPFAGNFKMFLNDNIFTNILDDYDLFSVLGSKSTLSE